MTSDPRPSRSGFRLPRLRGPAPVRGPASGGPRARLLVTTFLCLAPILVAPPPAAAQNLTSEEERIVAWVDAHVDDAVDLLERTVNINSGTMNFEGVRRVGDVYREELDALGFATRWIDMSETDRAGHLFATLRGGDGPRILLIGHLDTVFEEDSPFQRFVRRDPVVEGPGVEDMKGGNVVILYALKALDRVGALDDVDITVAFTGDEESPGDPLEVARRDLIEAGRRADVALGFEAAVVDEEGEWGTVARRSSSGWRLEVTGRQAHSSGIFSDEAGAGAIFEAARILDAFYDEVRGEEYLTFNAGVVLGGTDVEYDPVQNRGTAFGKTNVIPRRVVAHGGLRTISDEQLERARAAMREVVARHLPRTSAEIAFSDGYPAMAPTEANRRLLDVYSDVNEALGRGRFLELDPSRRGAADISFVAPHAGASLAGVGVTGRGGHSPEEEMDLDSLPLAIERAALLIYRLTRGAGGF